MATMVGVFNIGNDPEIRLTKDSQKVMDLSLAYRYGRKGPDGKYPSQWINATMWGDRAEKVLPYLAKGNKVFCVLSDVRIEEFQRKDGSSGSSLKSKISELELLGGRQEQTEHEKSKSHGYQPQYDDDDIPL